MRDYSINPLERVGATCYFHSIRPQRFKALVDDDNKGKHFMTPLEERSQVFLQHLCQYFGKDFGLSIDLLAQVLTHPSYAHENQIDTCYERLEFLGDAISNTLITKSLFDYYPVADEGTLSRLRAALISTDSLSQLGEILGLGQFLSFGKGEEGSDFSKSVRLLGRGFEALMGAIFLEKGFAESSRCLDIIVGLWEKKFTVVWFDQERLLQMDVKSRIQEIIHQEGLANPKYVMTKHSKQNLKDLFEMSLFVGEQQIASAQAPNKRDAEKMAAKIALENWNEIKLNLQPKDRSHAIDRSTPLK